jgi:very-short-patch-repair endonuclease
VDVRRETLAETSVDVLCSRCKTMIIKNLRYLVRRIRKGHSQFYCADCLKINKSESMSGENNPNFNGKFHGENPSDWSQEKRDAATSKLKQTIHEKGLLKGKNNPRWNGGLRTVNCVVCGNQSQVMPYVYKQITEGTRSPCCSRECATSFSRRHIKASKTSIEIKMAEELKNRQIEYIEQYNLGDKFTLDFFLPEFNIVIECDGNYWHTLPEVVKRDKSKNAYVKACGFSLYRFWESEINKDVEFCVDIVMAEINEKEAIKCRE